MKEGRHGTNQSANKGHIRTSRVQPSPRGMTGKSSVTERRSSAPASLGAQMMMLFNCSAKPLSANTIIDVRCLKCGTQRMLDARRDHTLRMFKCECGDQTWTDDAN